MLTIKLQRLFLYPWIFYSNRKQRVKCFRFYICISSIMKSIVCKYSFKTFTGKKKWAFLQHCGSVLAHCSLLMDLCWSQKTLHKILTGFKSRDRLGKVLQSSSPFVENSLELFWPYIWSHGLSWLMTLNSSVIFPNTSLTIFPSIMWNAQSRLWRSSFISNLMLVVRSEFHGWCGG